MGFASLNPSYGPYFFNGPYFFDGSFTLATVSNSTL
jgi:hypothetical protein